MKRFFARAGLVLVVLVVVFGALIGYLGTANKPPRRASPGWSRVANLPAARGEFAAAVVESKGGGPPLCPRTPCPDRLVYVMGGISGPFGSTTSDVRAYDPPTNSWRKAPALPEARHHAAASVFGESIYVTGGGKTARDWTPQANVWVLGPGRLSWQRLVDMPEARLAHGMVTIGNKLFVVAGRGATSRVEIYDAGLKKWSFGAEMPGKRDHAAVVAVDNKIYVIGGRDTKLTARVDVYDTTADSWAEGPALPVATSGATAALLSDRRIHVVGGEEPKTFGGSVRDIHFALDAVSGTWSEQPAALLAVHGAAGANVDGRLLIVGGSRRQGTLSVLGFTGFAQVFDPGEAQSQEGASPEPSSSPAASGSSSR